MKPCVRCLSRKYKRINRKPYGIIQCEGCSYNVTGFGFPHAEFLWNGFKVWELVTNKKVKK